ncbi:hypothetical protein [uncultured Friedmanniella sp.]|uniref:hypothetical protein n=1 Tax=uncultured Friedmanniella sp. TaxID=335381 RepID=UPI0035C9CFB0
MLEQLAVTVALQPGFRRGEEVDEVRVLGRLLREVGLLGWQRGVEVGDRFA